MCECRNKDGNLSLEYFSKNKIIFFWVVVSNPVRHEDRRLVDDIVQRKIMFLLERSIRAGYITNNTNFAILKDYLLA